MSIEYLYLNFGSLFRQPLNSSAKRLAEGVNPHPFYFSFCPVRKTPSSLPSTNTAYDIASYELYLKTFLLG